jgi:hypothetical protein
LKFGIGLEHPWVELKLAIHRRPKYFDVCELLPRSLLRITMLGLMGPIVSERFWWQSSMILLSDAGLIMVF